MSKRVSNNVPVEATSLQNFCVGMPGGQRTFELIPTTLVKSNENRRPMTSKAAKKAYQIASRGKKISRAEQRRQDAAELEAQKKEFEKEQALARAKAAREKKAAKALAEKEARKKKGIPEPSRFVRASQPTISRFIFNDSNGKRKWKEVPITEDADTTMSDSERVVEEPPAKRVAAVQEDSEDEFGDFPSLSQTDILEEIDSSLALTTRDIPAVQPSALRERPSPASCRREASQELPWRKSPAEIPRGQSEEYDGLATTQLLSDLAETIAKSDPMGPSVKAPTECSQETRLAASARRPDRVLVPLEGATMAHSTYIFQGNTSTERFGFESNATNSHQVPANVQSTKESLDNNHRSHLSEVVQLPQLIKSHRNAANRTSQDVKPFLQERSINMPPPRLPIKKAESAACIMTPGKPSVVKEKTKSKGYRTISSLPPTSTQAFLEDHLDDFFPSPTQELRELLDDAEDLSTITQIAEDLIPEKAEEPDNFDDLICTQALGLSPEDLAEIATPSRAPPKAVTSPASAAPLPAPREKRRFFEEKDEDVLHAAIQESRFFTASENPKLASIDAAPINRCHSDSSDYGEADIDFGDLSVMLAGDEDPQLEAAIRESKLVAEQEAKRAAALVGGPSRSLAQSVSASCGDIEEPSAEPVEEASYANREDGRAATIGVSQPRQKPDKAVRRFFQEKEEDHLHAAIYESRISANKTPLEDGPKPPKRALRRVQSTATDYGDDDFSGCSQELLDLCKTTER